MERSCPSHFFLFNHVSARESAADLGRRRGNDREHGEERPKKNQREIPLCNWQQTLPPLILKLRLYNCRMVPEEILPSFPPKMPAFTPLFGPPLQKRSLWIKIPEKRGTLYCHPQQPLFGILSPSFTPEKFRSP